MGGSQSFNNSIVKQEAYVDREFAKISKSSNYVGFTKSDRKPDTYSTSQIKGKLRQEYYGLNSSSKHKNAYVLSSDWDRMRNSSSSGSYAYKKKY